ncbi:Exodeoxyribonuclease III [Thalassoporum mexicanum PCC 7367]|uniref:exodeoxyribonuclease III n=1 Tax=Thalassoporum mexicanum TaxID=3457544 RepID=UPI00029FD510|nr:exodeoxyribonuclease III [Pseudanabaena sp. PCC 7367]AFY70824.1 Exodeoxyribonuclease III [Pseudanabaena sp. PCC 7367]
MQIATWNVNSVRTRLEQVLDWLRSHPEVDVLCLQETKAPDDKFPIAAFNDLGYQVYIYGQKSYNGVAIVAKQQMDEIANGFGAILGDGFSANNPDLDFDDQKRVISGVSNGVRIVNLYVPNGSAPGSEKYDYKLQWLAKLNNYLKKLIEQDGGIDAAQILVCGDLNVAIADIDIYDPSDRAKHIMSTDLERETLQAAVLNLGFQDAFRKFTPDAGHFSWWDYRGGSFRRNHGWRIDYHLLSPKLYEQAIACTIDIEPRRLEKPSDHTPVVVELQLA